MWPNIKAAVLLVPKSIVWERDVSNAEHFGNLGHWRRGRYCVRLEINALACFVPRKIRNDGKRVLCNELP